MRASRLIAMTLLLQDRGRLTAGEIAGELGVSPRTVYRDIGLLDEIGVPVIADRGPAGGYRLMDGYRTRLVGLHRQEAEALFLAGIPAAAADLGLGSDLSSAQRKVLASLPPELRDRAAAIRDSIHLDAPGWFLRSEELPQLRIVATALRDVRTLQMLYQRWSSKEPPVRREIEPLGLVLKGGVWYLGGRVRHQVRFYRVSRMLAVEIVDIAFERPPGFDLALAWRDWTDRFERNLYPIEATIRIDPAGLARSAFLLAPVAAQRLRDSCGAPDADGWCEAKMPIESVAHGVVDSLRIGLGIEVLEPPDLRAAVAGTAHRIAARYADWNGEGATDPQSVAPS